MTDYTKTNEPQSASRGTSAKIRNEFALIEASNNTKSDLASPAFTGVPTAPTAAAGTNTTQVATTAYADTGGASKADLASPAFTGVPTAPTAAPGTNTTQIATTAFNTASVALKANLASPAFTGIPTTPTAAPGVNTTQIASTAYVMAESFSTALPNQSGNAGKFVTTNGSVASWDNIDAHTDLNLLAQMQATALSF